jgi:hypothetical protein
MDFRTVVPVRATDFQLSHADRMLVLGSCFSEHIGVRLQESGFKACVNPFGVLYNPASVGMALSRLWNNRPFEREELVEHEGWFHSFSHHGSFSGTDPDATLDAINRSFHESVRFLEETTCLMLTFGTAWVYALPSTDQIVANCHKLPESQFLRRRLTVDEIVMYYGDLLDVLFAAKPDLKVLLTVSPIRHWKDGAHENTLSKSTLHLAIEELCEDFEGVSYYPAYELLMDDLRDYRFYAEDMLHPSAVAQKYVWDHFSETVFSKPTREIIRQVQQLRRAMQHKPFHPGSEEHLRFAKKNLAAIQFLQAASPEVDLSVERRYFEAIIDRSY